MLCQSTLNMLAWGYTACIMHTKAVKLHHVTGASQLLIAKPKKLPRSCHPWASLCRAQTLAPALELLIQCPVQLHFEPTLPYLFLETPTSRPELDP